MKGGVKDGERFGVLYILVRPLYSVRIDHTGSVPAPGYIMRGMRRS